MNTTMSLEEFSKAVKDMFPVADEQDLKAQYERIRKTYLIVKIVEEPQKWGEMAIKRFIKPERQSLYRAVYVDLAYDCDDQSFCPQDCPYEILLVNIETGSVFSTMQILERRSKRNDQILRMGLQQ